MSIAKSLAVRKVKGKFPASDFRGERGSIEAGLVIIPTTLLFMAVMQLVIAGAWQAHQQARLDDYVINSEIKGVEDSVGWGKSLRVKTREESGVGEVKTYLLDSQVPLFSPFFAWLEGPLRISNVVVAIE